MTITILLPFLHTNAKFVPIVDIFGKRLERGEWIRCPQKLKNRHAVNSQTSGFQSVPCSYKNEKACFGNLLTMKAERQPMTTWHRLGPLKAIMRQQEKASLWPSSLQGCVWWCLSLELPSVGWMTIKSCEDLQPLGWHWAQDPFWPGTGEGKLRSTLFSFFFPSSRYTGSPVTLAWRKFKRLAKDLWGWSAKKEKERKKKMGRN